MLMYEMIDESRKEKGGMKMENQRIKFKTKYKYHGWLGIDYRVFDYVSGKTSVDRRKTVSKLPVILQTSRN